VPSSLADHALRRISLLDTANDFADREPLGVSSGRSNNPADLRSLELLEKPSNPCGA